jgi:hypothetical protein
MEKNKIYKKFVGHKLIKEKYGLEEKDIPNNITTALVSEKPIIKTIAILVDELQSNQGINEVSLYNKINIYLQKNI